MSPNDGTRLCDESVAQVVRSSPPPRFAIFYADGSVIEDDGEDAEVVFRVPKSWCDAPRDGVQFVVCRRDDGRLQVLGGYDIYCTMPHGDVMATNDLGALMRANGVAKYGLWIPDAEYIEIREKANRYRSGQAGKVRK